MRFVVEPSFVPHGLKHHQTCPAWPETRPGSSSTPARSTLGLERSPEGRSTVEGRPVRAAVQVFLRNGVSIGIEGSREVLVFWVSESHLETVEK